MRKSHKSARILPRPSKIKIRSPSSVPVKSEISWKLNRERSSYPIFSRRGGGPIPIVSDDVRCWNERWLQHPRLRLVDAPCFISLAPTRLHISWRGRRGETAQANRPIDSSLPLIFHLANTGLRRATGEPEIPLRFLSRIKRVEILTGGDNSSFFSSRSWTD